MDTKARSIAVLVTLLALALDPSAAPAESLNSGAVYSMTNQDPNGVAVFKRAPDGTLSPAGTFLTGGSGNPVAETGDPPFDPLASQGALILSGDNRFLFAVNAGSNEISALAIFLDRVFDGKELTGKFEGARLRIVPSEKGKAVEEIT